MGEIDEIVSVLESVRDGDLSVDEARETIKEIAEAAQAKYPTDSADWIHVDNIVGKSKGYLDLIEAHLNESRFQFNPALQAIKKTVERARI